MAGCHLDLDCGFGLVRTVLPPSVILSTPDDPLLQALVDAHARARVVTATGWVSGILVEKEGNRLRVRSPGDTLYAVPVSSIQCVVVAHPPWNVASPPRPVTPGVWLKRTLGYGTMLGLMVWPVLYFSAALSPLSSDTRPENALIPGMAMGLYVGGILAAETEATRERKALRTKPRERPLVLNFGVPNIPGVCLPEKP